jgi:hypothetical protein
MILEVPKRPILITGSHRSGTTWIGRMLATLPDVRYVDEPFRTGLQRCTCGTKFNYWFQYVSESNALDFYEHIKHTIGLSFNAHGEFKASKCLGDRLRVLRKYASFLRGYIITRPLVKDPIAIFSAEWLASTFDMQVVVTIRHPAAFASSIKQFNWSHPFSHFLDQPLLMQDHLYPFETELREYAKREHDVIDQAALLWRLIYHTVLKYQDNHYNWIFLRHEDLSTDPLFGFETLFNQLNLEFQEYVKNVIREHSQSLNPSEPEDPYSIKRDSKANIWNWKNRLTESEIRRIRSQVEDISTAFYSDEDW